MRLIAYSGGEEQPIARSSSMVIAELQCPQTIILECVSVGVAEEAVEVTALDVINCDLSAAGISNQQVITEEAEVGRRNSDTPRRIQSGAPLQPLQEPAAG